MITKIDNDYMYQTIMAYSDESSEQLSRRVDTFIIPIVGETIMIVYKEWYALLIEKVVKVMYDRST